MPFTPLNGPQVVVEDSQVNEADSKETVKTSRVFVTRERTDANSLISPLPSTRQRIAYLQVGLIHSGGVFVS